MIAETTTSGDETQHQYPAGLPLMKIMRSEHEGVYESFNHDTDHDPMHVANVRGGPPESSEVESLT